MINLNSISKTSLSMFNYLNLLKMHLILIYFKHNYNRYFRKIIIYHFLNFIQLNMYLIFRYSHLIFNKIM